MNRCFSTATTMDKNRLDSMNCNRIIIRECVSVSPHFESFFWNFLHSIYSRWLWTVAMKWLAFTDYKCLQLLCQTNGSNINLPIYFRFHRHLITFWQQLKFNYNNWTTFDRHKHRRPFFFQCNLWQMSNCGYRSMCMFILLAWIKTQSKLHGRHLSAWDQYKQ